MRNIKYIKKLSALAAAFLLCIALASCSASPVHNDVESNDDVSSTESTQPEETTLEIMVKSEDFQKQVESLSESYESKGMKLEITAEGNTLIYTSSYTVDGVDIDEAKETLEEYLDSDTMTKSIEEVLQYVKKTVPETESVKVVYVDNDGNEIVSKEYK